MGEFVRKILSKYLSYISEKEMYERWLDTRENKEAREALVVVNMKVAMIQSWFNLLNTDERFVIEKHLLEELEWPRVAWTFAERWKGEFSRTERTLISYQASGIAKIARFVQNHRDMVMALFIGILSNKFCDCLVCNAAFFILAQVCSHYLLDIVGFLNISLLYQCRNNFNPFLDRPITKISIILFRLRDQRSRFP